MTYDSVLLITHDRVLQRRVLRRKAHLQEEISSLDQACSTFVTIANKYPEERKRNLFRTGLLRYRMGDLTRAREFFSQDSSSEFLYWNMRMTTRLGMNHDSLKAELFGRYPISYYTMIKEKQYQFYDTVPVNQWLSRFADTIPDFIQSDSLALKRAAIFFDNGEVELAVKELRLIKTDKPADIYQLGRLCQRYGVDHEAIRYGNLLKKIASNFGVKRIARDLLPILYPVRYAATISELSLDPSLVLAVIRQESAFNPRARSPANALGLMQIIPHTGRLLAQDFHMMDYDLFDPECSLKFGSKYLYDQIEAFDCLALALAAYNGGPINVTRWLNKDPALELDEFIELIPFDETREYVKSILLQKEIYTQLLNFGNLP